MGCLYRRKQKLADGSYRELPTWWIKYYQHGRAIRESTGKTKETAARKVLRTREGDVERGIPVSPKMDRLRFEEAAADLLNDYTTNQYDTRADAARRIDVHLTPSFGGRRMASITPADVRTYVARRKGATESVTRAHSITRTDGTVQKVRERRRDITGASNAEINRELAILKRMFTLAVEGGKLYHAPHIEMLRENNVRKGFFEREQFEAVCRHLKPHLRNVVKMAYITGWRTESEILPLEWRQVDFEAGEVRLDAGTTKNDEARVFPMTAALRTVLEEQRAIADERKQREDVIPRLVFTKQNGALVGSFRKAWTAACRAAGCPGRHVHDLRRTAVRNLVRAGIPEVVAMKMTGHKTRSVFDRYNIVSPGDLKDAARKLDARAHAVNAAGTLAGTNAG